MDEHNLMARMNNRAIVLLNKVKNSYESLFVDYQLFPLENNIRLVVEH